MIVSPGKAKSFHLSQEQTALVRDELRAILGNRHRFHCSSEGE